MDEQFSVPILFLVFNRPGVTARVFEAIRRQKPARLFVAADGPRQERPGEEGLCQATRDLILKGIDWDCEVKTYFRDKNAGCGRNVSEAITWFFEQVEEGIILEDDCLPNDSFFEYCRVLLEKYRYEEQISAISGNNFQDSQPMLMDSDYYFSVFPSSWGWATWRRAWQGYRLVVSEWQDGSHTDFTRRLFHEKKFQLWWKNRYLHFYNNELTYTWDFQFHFHSMRRKQLAIIPGANLISNIGHGPDATHFHDPNSRFANMPTYPLLFPLRHPRAVVRNYEADVFIQELLFGEIVEESPLKKTKRMIKKAIAYATKQE
jgi:hypothetical protein